MLDVTEDAVDETKFQLKYNFPQNEIPFVCEMVKKEDGMYGLQEIIAINIRTSLEVLQRYFNQVFCIPIHICYNDTVVGEFVFLLLKFWVNF